jgi:hypothetical protein
MQRSSFEDYFDFPLGLPAAGSSFDPDSRGYVYIIGFDEGNFVKIGQARCISTRIDALQCGIPYRLKLQAAVSVYSHEPWEIERAAHKLLADVREHSEWFAIDAVTALIAVLKAARDKKAKFGSWAARLREFEQVDHAAIREAEEEERRRVLRVRLGME